MLEVKQTLETFAKRVISRSRANLTRKNKNVSKELYNSLGYDVDVNNDGFSLQMLMEDYGAFQDLGVSGTERKYNTPYSYKSSSNLLGLELATGTFAKWAQFRNIRFRDSGGRFSKGNYKSIGVAIALAKKKKGIKPTHWFTKPFDSAVKDLPEELAEAFILEIDKKNFKK